MGRDSLAEPKLTRTLMSTSGPRTARGVGYKLVVSANQHVVFSYDSLDRLIQVSESTQTYSNVTQGPRLCVNVGFVCLCFFNMWSELLDQVGLELSVVLLQRPVLGLRYTTL